MSDLIERLRMESFDPGQDALKRKAADEIERLTAHCEGLEAIQDIRVKEYERLRAALERIANKPPLNEEYGNQGIDADEMMGIASEALKDEHRRETRLLAKAVR